MLEKQNLFPVEEYQDRVRKVCLVAEERGIDALIVTKPEDICYLTGYQTFGEAMQYLIVTGDGDQRFVLRELESHLAGLTTYVPTVATHADNEPAQPIVADSVREALGGNGVVGINMAALSISERQALATALAEMDVTDSDGVVESCRAIKSEREIEACRVAGSHTVAGMRAAFDAVRVGATENDVAAAAYSAMTRAGSEWLTHDPIVTSGPRSGIPHTSYARRRIAQGDTVLLEFSGCYFRYNAPLMRTCAVGVASDRAKSMYDACRGALESAMEAIKPGITSGEAHAAAQRVIDRAGYTDNFRKRLGYAIGLGFKSWSEGYIFDLKSGDQRVIEPGMVFHMPPALRDIGACGVGVSETIVVTDNGCEPISGLDRDLVVV